MQAKKRIALIAHDNKKHELVDWAKYNADTLLKHELYATGTTGTLLEQMLNAPIHKFMSGPLGGDQQIGALIAERKIDILIFFWDPMQAMPHDPDVKALLRIAIVWNIAIACDRSSADFIISSPLMDMEYTPLLTDYGQYTSRKI
ncbi:MAG: methylglyoxal synthase [Cytophagaceae bacterium]|nr:methylglyoxal synthase [Cytophagaceae bacterium]MDW8457309.1 methylglyoxal synthase [Cytophagaceae bacterium]